MAMAYLQPSWPSSLSLFPSSNPHHSKLFKLFSSLNSPNPPETTTPPVDPTKSYKKNPSLGNKELPPALKTAMERAQEYKQKKNKITNTNPGVESVKGKLSVSSLDFVGLGGEVGPLGGGPLGACFWTLLAKRDSSLGLGR